MKQSIAMRRPYLDISHVTRLLLKQRSNVNRVFAVQSGGRASQPEPPVLRRPNLLEAMSDRRQSQAQPPDHTNLIDRNLRFLEPVFHNTRTHCRVLIYLHDQPCKSFNRFSFSAVKGCRRSEVIQAEVLQRLRNSQDAEPVLRGQWSCAFVTSS